MKRRIIAASALLALLAMPSAASAQVGIFLGGGATFPTGDYKDLDEAKTGWMANAGLVYFIPNAQGLAVWGGGSYGSNKHEGTSGDKTNLYGANGGLLYRIGNVEQPGIYLFGGGGFLNHQFKPGDGSDSDNEWKFSYVGGAGVELPLSSVSLWVEGAYTGRSSTKFFGIYGGVTIPVGGGGGM